MWSNVVASPYPDSTKNMIWQLGGLPHVCARRRRRYLAGAIPVVKYNCTKPVPVYGTFLDYNCQIAAGVTTAAL